MQRVLRGSEWDAAMRRGDYEAAWRVSDSVLASRDLSTRDDPCLPYHRRWVWDGTRPDGREVLVRCYHGLGDTIQFSRYLPTLERRAFRLTTELQPKLMTFLGQRPGMGALVPFDRKAPAPRAECTLEIMELAHVLRMAPGPLPAQRRVVLPNSPLRVGLCWRGGGWDAARSVPVSVLEPLTTLATTNWVCLCQEPVTEAPAIRWQGGPLGVNADIAETASLLLGLDLVVTVDTMIAHLAGTLGVPTWLLLKSEPDWRWMSDRSDTPWYPSMRLFRQVVAGEWSGPVGRVAAELVRLQTAGTALRMNSSTLTEPESFP